LAIDTKRGESRSPAQFIKIPLAGQQSSPTSRNSA
jgi:hypothetical protein